MMNLPKDPVMLLSYVNTLLRDRHVSLEDFCKTHNIPQETLTATLEAIDYHYDAKQNRFL